MESYRFYMRTAVVMVLSLVLTTVPNTTSHAQPDSCSGACIQVGPRLVSIDSERGVLLDAIMTALLGSSVDLDVLDWNALAAGDISLLGFLDTLQTDLSVSSTSEVLMSTVTLEQFFIAAAKVAEADGNTVLANVLTGLAVDVAGLSGTIQLGDLLAVDFPEGALADIELNVLDLIGGLIQLYNYENVATTPTPVTISGVDLSISGLDLVVDSVQVYAQVIEPQVFVCGSDSAMAHTSAIRLKLDIDLVSASLDFGLAGVTAGLERLELYLEVARADALMLLVDAFSPQVDVEATPGVVDAYLGTLPDAVFFNREVPAEALEAQLDSTVVGEATLTLAVLSVDAQIWARSSGQGTSGTTLLTFNGPFPETQTAGNSATFVTNLVDDLLNNLDAGLTFSDPIPPALNALVASVLAALVDVVTTAITPPLSDLLSDFVDPLLRALGIGIGEMDVTVLGASVDPACLECDLSLTKLVDLSSPMIGDTISFSIILRNDGPFDATGVVVGDTLPSGFTFVSSSASNGSYDESTGLWTLGPVPNGTEDTLTLMVEVNADGDYFNIAQVTLADQPDPDSTPGNDDGDQSEDDEDGESSTPQQLPVELVAFNALQVDEGVIQLTWSTASERNNAGFEIQWITPMRNGAVDAESDWERAAFEEGAGNSDKVRVYTYRLEDLSPGRYRFRLKQINHDGSFELSAAIEALMEIPGTHELSIAYPNPFQVSTRMDLTISEPGRVVVDVFDALGRAVHRLHDGDVAAYRPLAIELAGDDLPGGVYFVRVNGERFSEVRRVVLIR